MAWRIDFTRNADKAMRKLDKGVAAREFPEQYREIIVGYNSILERYCRGNYLNAERKRKCVEQSGAKE